MKYIIYILTLITVTIGIAACSDEHPCAINPDDEKVTVRLLLALGDEKGITRGVPSDPIHEMKDGSIAENWVNDVQILVYNADGTKFIERASITGAPRPLTIDELEEKGIDASLHGSYYGIEGTLYELPYEDLKKNANFRFVVLCNLGEKDANDALYTSYGYGDGIGDSEFTPELQGHNELVVGTVDRTIQNLGYRGYTPAFTKKMLTLDNNGTPSEKARIPMWGFLQTTIQDQQTYTVDVLRSMAKVRVSLGATPAEAGFKLEGVTLSQANSAGYLAAQNINNDTRQAINSTTNTTNWNYRADNNNSIFGITDPSPLVDEYSPIITHSENTPLAFVGVDAEGMPIANGMTPAAYVIYIPEYRNMNSDGTTPLDNAATISLNITKDGREVLNDNNEPHKLLFAKYTDSNGNAIKPEKTEWDIIRNDYFDYTITKIEEPDRGGLTAQVRVMPWNMVEMEYEISQNSEVELLSEPEASLIDSRYTNQTVYSAEGGDENYAVFQIRVQQPTGVRWVAHLTDPYNFAFTDDSDTYGYGGDEIATIKVKPRGKYTENISTELYFTIETLIDNYANICKERSDIEEKFYGLNSEQRTIHITQVETKEETSNVAPFTVAEGYLGTATTGTVAGKNGVVTYAALGTPIGMETFRVFDADGSSATRAEDGTKLTDKLFRLWESAVPPIGKDSEPTDCKNQFGTTVGNNTTIYGHPNVEYNQFADLTGYTYMTIKGTAGTVVRLLLNRIVNQAQQMEIKPTIPDGGSITIPLTGYPFVHLHAIKLPNGGQVDEITLHTGTSPRLLNNGVVMAHFNGYLYCMWQSSAQKEDTPDTHVLYSRSNDDGKTWETPRVLCPAAFGGYSSSGGWYVDEKNDRLVAYINTWKSSISFTTENSYASEMWSTTTFNYNGTTYGYPNWAQYKPTYGYTRYMTLETPTSNIEDEQWSKIKNVTMNDGGDLEAIFEQDPHVIELKNGGKRIINAGHFRHFGNNSDGLYVCPIYADYTEGGISGWKRAGFSFSQTNGSQSREMEPSLFRKANGSLVMIFRDNMQQSDGTYEHRVRASISTDEGLTWSTPVTTNMLDSKSKQCAGNLPDGTAFIINNPVENTTRCPLVIHLSKDGNVFTKAYILRDGTTKDDAIINDKGMQPKETYATGTGYSYPKAMVNGDYLYVSYSTHKSDVEYTRIPLSSIQLNN